MAKVRIMPQARLPEWMAQEKGSFKDEGVDYECVAEAVGGQVQRRIGWLVSRLGLTQHFQPKHVLLLCIHRTR
jgi:hypothetical protein